MMKKIDISSYLHPTDEHDRGDQTSEDGACSHRIHDPTYSSLLGWGFSGMPKLLPPDPHHNGRRDEPPI